MSEPIVVLSIDGVERFFSVDVAERRFTAVDNPSEVYYESDLGSTMEEILSTRGLSMLMKD